MLKEYKKKRPHGTSWCGLFFSFELLDLHLVTNEIPRCCQLYTADSCGARAIKAYYLFKIARITRAQLFVHVRETCTVTQRSLLYVTAQFLPFQCACTLPPLQGRAWMSKQSHKLNLFFTENSLRLLIRQFTRLLYYKII
jgi:hypothetical protein